MVGQDGTVRKSRALFVVPILVLAACSGDSPDDATVSSAVAPVVTSTTDLAILQGSGAETPSSTPATAAPSSSAAPTSEATSSPPGPPIDIDACAALASLATGPNPEALATLLASAESGTLVAVDIDRVLSDNASTSAARAIAVAALDDAAGLSCGLEGPATVTLEAGGLDVGTFGQDRGLVASAVSILFGLPAIDTGPIDPDSAYGICPGAQLWVMEWPFLILLFTDDGDGPEAFEFLAWRSFDVGEDSIPPIPATPEGVFVGAPFDGLLGTFADQGAVMVRDELLDVDVVDVPDTYLFRDNGSGLVGFMEGGEPCGE